MKNRKPCVFECCIVAMLTAGPLMGFLDAKFTTFLHFYYMFGTSVVTMTTLCAPKRRDPSEV